jgi:hypothetical protein
MFIRFRQAGRRLQLSIIETSRQGGRVPRWGRDPTGVRMKGGV